MTDDNEVRIELDGESALLRCTPRAAKEINAHFGSFREAAQRVDALDYAAFVAIIAVAVGKERKAVEDSVWGAGLTSLAAPLTRYIVLLANGGRMPKNSEEPAPGEV